MKLKHFLWKFSVAAFMFSCLMVLPAAAMMDERWLWETIVLDGDVPFSQQVVREGVCYEVRDTIDLGGSNVDMPVGCKLSFVGGMLSNGSVKGNGCLIGNSGGDIIFGRQFAISDVANKEVSLGWFDLPDDLDASGIIGGLVENPAVEVLNLAGKTVRMTCVDLSHSLTVTGSGATIVPVLKTENSYYGLFRCQDGMGNLTFQFSNLRVIGYEEVKCEFWVPGDRLFHFNNCDQVKFDHVVIGNIAGGYRSSKYGYEFNAGLIACYDVKKLRIEKCEFFNDRCFEWMCDMPINLHRNDIDVVFNDNYIHDANEGATPVYFICNHLELRRNIVRDCQYSGSLFNVHGYHAVFTDNDIRGCIYNSIFDTCEYGEPQKTSLGEVAYYSDTVECTNNYCDCANATLLVTWARSVLVKDNYFSGMCLCNAQGCGNLGNKPDTDFITPTNESVTITGNTCYGDHVDESKALSYYHNFVRIASVYILGGSALIEGNTFRRSSHIDDFPFSISNMKEVVIKKNTIQGCHLYDPGTMKYGLTKVENTFSVYYPLDDIDTSSIQISNNTVIDPEGKLELVVKTLDGNKNFSIKKQETKNNTIGLRTENSRNN